MRFLPVFAASLFLATAAQAHDGDSSASGWAHDLLHALGGVDHTVALITVGLLFVLIALAPLAGARLARSLAAVRTLFGKGRAPRG